MYQKSSVKENMLIYHFWENTLKRTMFLSKMLIHLHIIIHYMVEDNIFAVIVYSLLAQKKYEKGMLNIALKLMVKSQ